MEYLFHRYSDLYAGAKGQRQIGGRKTGARRSRSLGSLWKMNEEKAGLITATRMRPVNHCCGWYSNMCWLEHSLSHKRSLFLSLSFLKKFFFSSCRQRGGMGRWKCWMRDKTSEGKRDLLGIHLSLWINKGNLGWFLPVGLLADRRGEGSATAELQGARIT